MAMGSDAPTTYREDNAALMPSILQHIRRGLTAPTSEAGTSTTEEPLFNGVAQETFTNGTERPTLAAVLATAEPTQDDVATPATPSQSAVRANIRVRPATTSAADGPVVKRYSNPHKICINLVHLQCSSVGSGGLESQQQ